MPLVLLERSDGKVSVMNVTDPNGDVGAEISKWETTAGGVTAPDFSLIVAADLPATRRWRNAWRHSAGAVTIPLAAARLLRRAELLIHRAKLLVKLALLIDLAVAAGQTVLANVRRTKRTNALLKDGTSIDADLAAVSDLATLDTFTPAALADDEPDQD